MRTISEGMLHVPDSRPTFLDSTVVSCKIVLLALVLQFCNFENLLCESAEVKIPLNGFFHLDRFASVVGVASTGFGKSHNPSKI